MCGRRFTFNKVSHIESLTKFEFVFYYFSSYTNIQKWSDRCKTYTHGARLTSAEHRTTQIELHVDFGGWACTTKVFTSEIQRNNYNVLLHILWICVGQAPAVMPCFGDKHTFILRPDDSCSTRLNSKISQRPFFPSLVQFRIFIVFFFVSIYM